MKDVIGSSAYYSSQANYYTISLGVGQFVTVTVSDVTASKHIPSYAWKLVQGPFAFIKN